MTVTARVSVGPLSLTRESARDEAGGTALAGPWGVVGPGRRAHHVESGRARVNRTAEALQLRSQTALGLLRRSGPSQNRVQRGAFLPPSVPLRAAG